MGENMALLSQPEIDALVEFLTEKKNVNGEVLDQKSIDKLVSVLQDGHFVKKMRLSENIGGRTLLPGISQALLLEEESDLLMQQENCCLLFEEKPDGSVEIICENTLSGKRYTMTPACLEQGEAETEESTWGKAVPPVIFDNIAALLRVKYTRKTFVAVCERYAEVMYGNKEQVLPSVYMPNGSQLMQHMTVD